MRIYIVTVGEYEDNCNGLCTMDYNKALEYFLEHYSPNNKSVLYHEEVASLEIWENDKKIGDYGEFTFDRSPNPCQITFAELKEDVEKHIRERSLIGGDSSE